MKRIQLLLSVILISITIIGQEYDYKFRLTLTDKGKSSYSIKEPRAFLSEKSIERRVKQGITIDKYDLPISDKYLSEIEALGATIVTKSRWMQTITVHCEDSAMVYELKKLPFVSDAMLVWRRAKNSEIYPPIREEAPLKENYYLPEERIQAAVYRDYYGVAGNNIKLVNGQYLHNAGFKGQGVDIAVIDGGYKHLPYISLLDNITIKATKGFVYEEQDIYHNRTSPHGLNVLSCMATNKPYTFVGTAPEASYTLLVSEENASEYPIEEDYWAAAIEYADSLGIDVVNTSLGYSRFDAPTQGFTHEMLDGKSTLISRAADMAANKGMLIVCSAGNSGVSDWKKLTPPADAKNVLTVGATLKDSTMAAFSSYGFTADFRVKPDVVALGASAAVIGLDGYETTKNGTSFSSPIICGLVACLWQAYPSLTNKEIIRVMRESANRFNNPDNHYGYGLPDMQKAMTLAEQMVQAKSKK